MLLDAWLERAGGEALATGWRCTGFAQDERGVSVAFDDPRSGTARPPQQADIVVACDGLHSAIRKQLHPGEGRAALQRRQHVARRLALETDPRRRDDDPRRLAQPGKMVIYPIRDNIDGSGTQLVNWVAEIETATTASATGPGPAGSPTSSAPSRIGTSTGSTCRR